jgi:ribonuclease Z
MIRSTTAHLDKLWPSNRLSGSSNFKLVSCRRTIVSGTTNGVQWFNSHCGSMFRHMPNTCWTVVPLGTSSAVPSPRRNVTATYLRMLSNGYLFDAGEGTFNQMRACYLCSLKSLRRVFITHMHGDHVFGLPSILMYSLELARTYSAMGRDMADLPRLQLFGPLGLYNYLRTAFIPAGKKGWESIPVDIFELVPQTFRGTLQHTAESKSLHGGAKNHNYLFPDADGYYSLVDDEDHTVQAAPISHSISCYGYVVNEKERRHMMPALAMQRGIPPGPIYSKLQKGTCVRAPDGSLVKWEDVSFSSGVGRKVVILGDNANADSIIPLAQHADVSKPCV